MTNHEIRLLVLDSGRCPFQEWLGELRDLKARAIVRTRIDRVSLGNFGNCRDLKDGLWELKIDFGPGYRLYFGKAGNQVVLLLTGGDKSSQIRDIKTAKEYWRSFLAEKADG